MKKIAFLLVLWSSIGFSQKADDSIQFKKISDEILLHGEAYENLRELTQDIGNRLSGSENYEKAVAWAEQKLKEAGADKVWLQEVMVPVWERGKESLKIKFNNGKTQELRMTSLGNSEGTNGKDISGEILMVNSIDEFEKFSDDQVKGKIVFFNYPFKQEFVETFRAYSDAGKYRFSTASLVAKKGGKFVIVRSLSSGMDDVPHTGVMVYDNNYAKIPAVAIGNTTADELARMINQQKITATLNSNCGMKAEKLTHSVIGEITGKKDGKVIVVGGHLDSWDVGEGAHDDGAGIVQSIEILRAFKKLGIQNNHTIRVVCFANEENGSRGGKQYAETAKTKNETHLLAIESDAGGFTPRGLSLEMEEAKRKQIQSWSSLFLPYGIYDFSKEYGGVDIDPLKEESNVPLAGLVPDSQRYFDIHHTDEDTFEKVNRRELHLGAIAMGQLIFMADKYW